MGIEYLSRRAMRELPPPAVVELWASAEPVEGVLRIERNGLTATIELDEERGCLMVDLLDP